MWNINVCRLLCTAAYCRSARNANYLNLDKKYHISTLFLYVFYCANNMLTTTYLFREKQTPVTNLDSNELHQRRTNETIALVYSLNVTRLDKLIFSSTFYWQMYSFLYLHINLSISSLVALMLPVLGLAPSTTSNSWLTNLLVIL